MCGTTMSYQEMQDFLMNELRLMHYPVAVKFIFKAEELEDFQKNVSYYEPNHKLTFCQFEIGARMEGLTVFSTKDKLGCPNAAYVFGWKEMDDKEIKSHMKYVKDEAQAERFVRSKPRLPEGALKAIVVSPLGQTYFPPDVLHFYCDNMQSYHLMVNYMGAMDVHPIRPNVTMNSAACAGTVFAYNEKMATTHPACSGSYNAGKTERGETNVMIPGVHLAEVMSWMVERKKRFGSSSIVKPGNLFPGADICKNCPLISFKAKQ